MRTTSPHPTPSLEAISLDALAEVSGGCGKKKCCCPRPQPQPQAQPQSSESISTSVSVSY